MGRYDKYYLFVDDYFSRKVKRLWYSGKWHTSYSPSSGNAKIKKLFIRDLCSNCSGAEVKFFLMLVDSLPETDNPYESQVVKIVRDDWNHVLSGRPFRAAINLFLELGYLERTPIGTRYIINPWTWCNIKQ